MSEIKLEDVLENKELLSEILDSVDLVQEIFDRKLQDEVISGMEQPDIQEFVDREDFISQLTTEDLVDVLKQHNRVDTFQTRDWETQTWVSMNGEIVYCKAGHQTILVIEEGK